jgi:hypothetical protein
MGDIIDIRRGWMAQNQNNSKTAHTFIEEGQFNLKLPFTYTLLTGVSFVLLIVIFYFIGMEIGKGLATYGVCMMLYYKFVFKFTKKGQQFQPYFINKLENLSEKIRLKSCEV